MSLRTMPFGLLFLRKLWLPFSLGWLYSALAFGWFGFPLGAILEVGV